MARTIYLNFSDLSEETQQEITSIAEEDIRNDEAEMEDIIDMYGEKRIDEIVSERAERKINEYNYVFNV